MLSSVEHSTPQKCVRPRSSGGSWCFVEAIALQLVFSHSLAGGGNKYPLAHPVQRQVSSESGILKHTSACLRQLCCCVLTQMSRPVFRKAYLRMVLPRPHQEQPAWPVHHGEPYLSSWNTSPHSASPASHPLHPAPSSSPWLRELEPEPWLLKSAS